MLLYIKLYDQHHELAYSHSSTALIYCKHMDFIGILISTYAQSSRAQLELYIYQADHMFLPFFVSLYCYENL